MAEPHPACSPARCDLEQALGKLDRGKVGGGQDACAGLRGERRFDRRAQRGVAVPEAHRTPGGGEVKQPPAVLHDQLRAFAAGYGKREEPQVLQSGKGSGVTLIEVVIHSSLPALSKVRDKRFCHVSRPPSRDPVRHGTVGAWGPGPRFKPGAPNCHLSRSGLPGCIRLMPLHPSKRPHRPRRSPPPTCP